MFSEPTGVQDNTGPLPTPGSAPVTSGTTATRTGQAVRADALLLLTALLWGSGFSAQRAAADHVESLTFNAARYAIATIALLPALAVWGRRPSSRASWTTGQDLRAGALAGAALCLAAWLQQAGIAGTTAGKAGFITGLYVILVPLLAWFAGTRPAWTTWPAAAMAVGGLYLLSGQGSWTLSQGDALVLASAVVWAVHVLIVSHFAVRMNGIRLAWLQMAFSAALSIPAALWLEGFPRQALAAAAVPILYNGLVCGALAFTLQILGQRHAPPAHAAILMSLEAVFAAFFGWILLGERLDGRGLAGCVLMFAGICISQAPLLRRSRA